MADLNDPTSGLLLRITPLAFGLLPTVDDVRDVAVAFDDLGTGSASVSRVGAQVFAAPERRLPPSLSIICTVCLASST